MNRDKSEDLGVALDLDVAIAVGKLTEPWSEVLGPKEMGDGRYVPIDYPPLLDMLDEACRSGIGGVLTSGRSDPASRNLLNLEALSLREHIDGTVRAWIGVLSKSRPEPNLKDAVTQLSSILKAHRAAGTIPDSESARLGRLFTRWVGQVWSLFDPPIVKELAGACPTCSEAFYETPGGSRSAALIAYYWKGIRPEARCQRCWEKWEGERELLNLGYHLGATVDEEALKEMGVL